MQFLLCSFVLVFSSWRYPASSNQKEMSVPAAAMMGCAKGPSYSASSGVKSSVCEEETKIGDRVGPKSSKVVSISRVQDCTGTIP